MTAAAARNYTAVRRTFRCDGEGALQPKETDETFYSQSCVSSRSHFRPVRRISTDTTSEFGGTTIRIRLKVQETTLNVRSTQPLPPFAERAVTSKQINTF